MRDYLINDALEIIDKLDQNTFSLRDFMVYFVIIKETMILN